MPIYEYACKNCGHSLEARQKIADDPLTDCPACGSATLERLVSASSFSLKGGGWYADGYGESKKTKDSSDTSNSKDSGDKGKSEKKDTSSANDSKPTKPTETKKSETKKSEAKKAS